MGMFDFLKRLNGSPATYQGQEVTYGPSLIHDEVLGMSHAEVWRTQPHLRTVVTFLGRNVAQCAPQTFMRVGETDRRRLRDGKMAEVLKRPNTNTTVYELIYGIVADLALFDVAYLHFTKDADAPSGWSLYRLPPDWVTPQGGDAFAYSSYMVQVNGGVSKVRLPAESVIDFHGWNPTDTRYGSSPVAALKAILAEQMMAVAHRQQVWQHGGRVSSVITRPADKPWAPEARESFRKDWRSKFSGAGSEAGGTPILEDGMTISTLDFNAHEQQFVEAAKLSLATVAGVYHTNPTMLGDNTGANFSNVREFRKMLYGDTLGPIFNQLEDRFNTFLVPILDPRPGVYVEFNIAEKLQGNFEEQAVALSTSVGAPYMLRSEARARMNLPSIPDADTLVVPLNVLTGGQASPQDSAPKAAWDRLSKSHPDYAKQCPDCCVTWVSEDLAQGCKTRHDRELSPVQFKARAPQSYEDKYAEVMRKFFRRQGAVVKTALGVKAAGDYWDESRWDSELSDDLYRLAVMVAGQVSAKTLDSIGFSPDEYDVDRTLAWLREASDRSATSINATTKAAVDLAIAEDDQSVAVTNVYDVAEGSRSTAIAVGAVTMLSAFATVEAAKQVAGDKAEKTWIVTSKNPRPSHSALSGETVPLSEDFSNGMAWPGDSSGGADEVAGCTCELSISVA